MEFSEKGIEADIKKKISTQCSRRVTDTPRGPQSTTSTPVVGHRSNYSEEKPEENVKIKNNGTLLHSGGEKIIFIMYNTKLPDWLLG